MSGYHARALLPSLPLPMEASLTQQPVVSGWSVGEVSRAAEQTGFASILRDVIRVVLF